MIQEKKKLAKVKNKKQGADNYETFLNDTFIYPSKGVVMHEGVKPYFRKITESVVGESSSRLVEAEE